MTPTSRECKRTYRDIKVIDLYFSDFGVVDFESCPRTTVGLPELVVSLLVIVALSDVQTGKVRQSIHYHSPGPTIRHMPKRRDAN